MGMVDMLALPFVSLSVGDFLEISDLASCERARLFSPSILEQLWTEAAWRWFENQVLWSCMSSFMYTDLQGKMLVSEMRDYRRAVIASPLWEPWITQMSFCSIKVTPNVAFQSGDIFGESPELPTKPDQANIPVAVGSNRGQTLIFGMEFAAAGRIDDGLYIGIVGTGRNLYCQTVLVSFAPFSGKCFIEHDDGIAFQALPRPCQVLPWMEGYVWCRVTEKGSIQFVRQFKLGPVEVTGLIPHEKLDKDIESYFPNIIVCLSQLETDLTVSVEHSGYAFPADMCVSNTDLFEIDSN